MNITIGKNTYPLAICPRKVNNLPCSTAMNPARLLCTGCEQAFKERYQKALEIVVTGYAGKFNGFKEHK